MKEKSLIQPTEKELIKFINFLQKYNMQCEFVTTAIDGTPDIRIISKILFRIENCIKIGK